MSDTLPMHEEIRRGAPAFEDHALHLTTDGSGQDGKANAGTGSAWRLRSLAMLHHNEVVNLSGGCAALSGSVQRGEMMALLEGLRAAAELMGLTTLDSLAKFAGRKLRQVEDFPAIMRPRIWWTGDRENLVLQVARKPDGHPYFTRRTEPDLWFSLYWWEHVFRITPVWAARNTSADQRDVDRRAGIYRATMIQTLSSP